MRADGSAIRTGRDVPTLEDGTLADFAWAREQSFAMPPAEYDWLLWLDADDVVVGGEHLRRLVAEADPEIDGFLIEYEYGHDVFGNCARCLWRKRVLRRDRGFRWANPVHEVCGLDRREVFPFVGADLVRYVHAPGPDQ